MKFKIILLLLAANVFLSNCATSRTPEYHLKLAGACYNKGDYPGAVIECNNALIEYPFHKEAQNNLGNAYAKMELWDKAIQSYQQAIWIKESYPPPHYGIAVAYTNTKELEKAVTELTRYLELVPGDKNAKDLLRQIKGAEKQ